MKTRIVRGKEGRREGERDDASLRRRRIKVDEVGQEALVTKEILDDLLEVGIGGRGISVISVVPDCEEGFVEVLVLRSCRGKERGEVQHC